MNSAQGVGEQLWIELPPIQDGTTKRVLVLLHGTASSPDLFVPVAIAWQLKFPSATAFVLQAPILVAASNAVADTSAPTKRYSWIVPSNDPAERALRIAEAAQKLSFTLALIEQQTAINASKTIVIGFGEGANLALEIALAQKMMADIVVSYAGQLARSLTPQDRISARSVHLLHGELDSIVTPDKSQRAFRLIQSIHPDVSIDVLIDGTHIIDQESIIVGTTRAMQSIFKGRKRAVTQGLH